MSSAIARAKAHFAKFTGKGRRSISIPEWADEAGAPLVVYWQPLTLAEKARIFPGTRPASDADAALLLVAKAEYEDGSPMFPDVEDIEFLRAKVDQAIVTRIGVEIMRSPSVGDAAKNS